MAEEDVTPGTSAEQQRQGERAKKAAYMREYRKKNPERQRSLDKTLESRKRAKDPEKFKAAAKERTRRYRERKKAQGGFSDEELEAKREANRERNAKYRDRHRNTPEYKARLAANAHRRYVKNPEKMKDYVHRRRTKLEDGSVTTGEWAGILTRYGNRCAYCRTDGVPLTQDHVVPLTKGGTHCAANVVPACCPCNTRKNNRPWPRPEPPTETGPTEPQGVES